LLLRCWLPREAATKKTTKYFNGGSFYSNGEKGKRERRKIPGTQPKGKSTPHVGIGGFYLLGKRNTIKCWFKGGGREEFLPSARKRTTSRLPKKLASA